MIQSVIAHPCTIHAAGAGTPCWQLGNARAACGLRIDVWRDTLKTRGSRPAPGNR